MSEADEDARAIRTLVETYAAGVDARRYPEVAALFGDDGVLATFMVPGSEEGRETVGQSAIAAALTGVERYVATVHAIANHRADISTDRQHAVAATHCFAHHLERDADGGAADRVLTIRYTDHLAVFGDEWQFTRREVRVLWIDRRVVGVT